MPKTDRQLAAEILSKKNVCKASDLVKGPHDNINVKKLNPFTSFSTEVLARDVKANPYKYPEHVCEFVGNNPNVRKVCFVTNTEELKKALSS